MPVIQVPMYIPEDVYAGLLSGDYVRIGGVVRDTSGRIVSFLEEADLPSSEEAKSMAGQAVKLARNLAGNKYFQIAAAGAALAGAAVGVHYAVKAHAAKKASAKRLEALNETEASFNQAVAAYLNAIQNGKLNDQELVMMINSVEAVSEELQHGDVTVTLSNKQLETLVAIMRDYTTRLANANDMELEKEPDIEEEGEYDNLILLAHFLNEQMRILDAA